MKLFGLRGIFLASALALVCGPVSAEGFFGGGGLGSLAGTVPRGAQGEVVLVDVAAARREVRRVAPGVEEISVFAHLYAPAGFAQAHMMIVDMETSMGFGLADIDGMAGWGEPPSTPVVVAGSDRMRAAIADGAALAARGFAQERRQGVPVWWRQGDGELDFQRREEDLFTAPLGFSMRFALKEGRLVAARTWREMDLLLGSPPSILDDADDAAVVASVDGAEGMGAAVQLRLLPPLALLGDPRAAISGGVLPEDPGPPMPPLGRVGLVEWQDGTRLTAGLAISFATAEMAEEAALALPQRLAAVRSLVRPDMTFGDLLGAEPEVRVVPGADRTVLLVAWSEEADAEALASGSVMALMQVSPMRRLVQMYNTADIVILLAPYGA